MRQDRHHVVGDAPSRVLTAEFGIRAPVGCDDGLTLTHRLSHAHAKSLSLVQRKKHVARLRQSIHVRARQILGDMYELAFDAQFRD